LNRAAKKEFLAFCFPSSADGQQKTAEN